MDVTSNMLEVQHGAIGFIKNEADPDYGEELAKRVEHFGRPVGQGASVVHLPSVLLVAAKSRMPRGGRAMLTRRPLSL